MSALEDARVFFADEGVPFPPIPEAFAPRVAPVGPRDWGFGGPDVHLIMREDFVNAVETDPTAEFLRFGRDGSSFTSEAVCYYVATGSVAILLQFRWGGYQFELADSAEALRGIWAGAAKLLELAGAPGPRVVVYRSFFDLSCRWARLDGGIPDWRTAPANTLFDEAYASISPRRIA